MTNSSSNKWIKDKKGHFTEKIKESVKTTHPLKPQVELAKNKIQTQNQKLEFMLDKLRLKEKSLFNQVVATMQKHDIQQGKMLSNELAQVKKTTKTISQMKIALEQIQLRLESTLDIGEVMSAIGPATGALTRIKNGLSGMMPEVNLELGEINSMFGDIITNAGSSTCNTSLGFDANGEDVERILDEANAVAEQRTSDSFPDAPIGSFTSPSRFTSASRSSIDEHKQ
jgi:division protein CdvB (Snf7/Vps24/ESCRT-III family)